MADKVYQLVRSLTKSEQRYFHRYAHQHRKEAPNYWYVYEAMAQMPDWNEREFSDSLRATVFFRHLPVVKSQLYDRLLDALHLYHRENEVEEQIKRALHQAYLLHKRGLRRAFQQHLQRCRKLINTHQLWIFWPELMSLEQLSLEQPGTTNNPSQNVQLWVQSYQEGLDQLKGSLPAVALKAELAQTHLKRVRPDQIQIEKWQSSLHQTSANDNLNVQAYLHQSEALIAFMRRDSNTAGQANAKLLQILEQQSPDLRLIPERYLSTLYNYLIDQLQLGQIETFEDGLIKLRQLPSRKAFRRIRGIQRKIFEWGFQLELNHLVKKKEYNHALERLPELATGLTTHKGAISPAAEAGLRHLAGLIAFQGQQPELALQFITTLYQEAKPAVAHEIYHYAELLYILCHFELQHHELIDHLITSYQRRLRNQKNKYAASLDCLQFIRKLQAVVSKSERAKVWNSWLEKLEEFPPGILIYLDLEHWIKQKVAAK